MKQLLLFSLLLFATCTVCGQKAPDENFVKALEAFSQENYPAALKFIDAAEKKSGETAETLNIRLMSQYSLLVHKEPENKTLLASALASSNRYLKLISMEDKEYAGMRNLADVLKYSSENNYYRLGKFAQARGENEKCLLNLEKAATQGYLPAMVALGNMYSYGNGGVVRDHVKGMEWLNKAADMKSAEALFAIGDLYLRGIGVKRNYETTFAWYKRSAMLGYSEAIYKVGRMYNLGVGTTKDTDEAAKWLRKAANMGHELAMVELAGGKALQFNEEEKFAWRLKAAALGSTTAMCYLGDHYIFGWGTPRDNRKGVEWLEKASERGNYVASEKLADLYENIVKVKSEAEKWRQKAEEQRRQQAK